MENEPKSNGPYIEVWNTDSANKVGKVGVDLDSGPLAMPASIHIGSKGTDCGGNHDYTICSYSDQVDEYGIWLEARVAHQDMGVLMELDRIFQLAEAEGVILMTNMKDSPDKIWHTHAHQVKKMILKLAENLNG